MVTARRWIVGEVDQVIEEFAERAANLIVTGGELVGQPHQ